MLNNYVIVALILRLYIFLKMKRDVSQGHIFAISDKLMIGKFYNKQYNGICRFVPFTFVLWVPAGFPSLYKDRLYRMKCHDQAILFEFLLCMSWCMGSFIFTWMVSLPFTLFKQKALCKMRSCSVFCLIRRKIIYLENEARNDLLRTLPSVKLLAYMKHIIAKAIFLSETPMLGEGFHPAAMIFFMEKNSFSIYRSLVF